MHNSIEPSNCIQRLRTLPTEVVPPYHWQEFQRRSSVATGAAASQAVANWRPLAAAAALLLFVCAIAVWGRFGGGGRHVVVDSTALEDGMYAWSQDVGATSGPKHRSQGVASPADPVRARQGAGPTAGVDGWSSGAGPTAGVDGWSLGAASTAGVDGWSSGAASTAGVDRWPSGEAGAGLTSRDSNIAVKRSRAIESWLASLPREPAVVHVGTRAAVATLEDRIAQVDDLMTSLRISGTPSDRVAALQQERLRLVGSLAQVRYAEVVASTSP